MPPRRFPPLWTVEDNGACLSFPPPVLIVMVVHNNGGRWPMSNQGDAVGGLVGSFSVAQCCFCSGRQRRQGLVFGKVPVP